MRVAIIGAGFSGMLAAYLLEQKGITVTVFEKQEYIGGHCRTIVNSDFHIEMGTVFSFSSQFKPLLIELGIAYSERFTYRNFVDEFFSKVEHISQTQVAELIEELARLEQVLKKYQPDLNALNYAYIHEDLMLPLYDFLEYYDLKVIRDIIAPHLSSYGFGNMNEIQAYYVFNIFNVETIYAFIRGDKFLFVDHGFSEIIKKLSQRISDIRYAIEVVNVEMVDYKVKVETAYGFDWYDKVLITTKLPRNVIKDELYNHLMMQIDTNPYITCAYEVANKNIVTTYYKANLGQKEKVQFFHTYKQQDKTILVAYAYGNVSKALINNVTEDIKKSGIQIKHLITAKQWHIFPHIKLDKLSSHFYVDITEHQKDSHIHLIGSLISKPSISNLYESVKAYIDQNY